YTKSKASMLSDAIITIRNDRYVLPVKQEHRGSIGGIVHDQSASGQTLFMEPKADVLPVKQEHRGSIGGIVHDQSASGQTLFMEPKAVVELNNQLQEAILQEKREIERILSDLSQEIAESETYLTENVLTLGEIDFIFARAKLGAVMNAAMPKMNNNGFIKMEKARHPLIRREEVVANDVEIGRDYTAIVITGPNTGGKTVTIKMIGLCTLMAQSGLQVPALDGCEMSVFENVFADIGDEQSIE